MAQNTLGLSIVLGWGKSVSAWGFPDTGLKQAREKRDEARKQLAEGVDSSENRKAVKSSKVESAVNSFELIAREWGAKKVDTWAEKITVPRECLNDYMIFIAAVSTK